ncbi:MAG: hypothetical protein O3A14_10385 [Cyanobacteria bacterium]|nr:hypothetical protein [Cyanobacteriota bacterium]
MVDSQQLGSSSPLPINPYLAEAFPSAPGSVVSLLYTLIQTVNQAADFSVALEQVVEQICRHTQWVLGEVWLPSADQQHLKNSGVWWACDRPLEDV